MELYFADYSIVRKLLIKNNRGVLVARANQFNPDLPQEFIIKYFSGTAAPKEFYYHDLLFRSFPNMLRLFCSWEDGQNFYMAIEYCSGGDLHKYLQDLNGKPIDLNSTLIFSYQLAETVWNMHQLKIAHRDIKPLNVFIDSDFSWFKLGDFGEAKEILEDSEGHTLRAGTPLYMSPEKLILCQQNKGSDVDPLRSDIWALGKTMLEIFMGKLCPETFRMDERRLHGYIDESFQRRNLDPEFGWLIMWMMSEEASYNTTAEMVMAEINRLYNKHFPAVEEKIKDEHIVTANIYKGTSIPINLNIKDSEDLNKMIANQILNYETTEIQDDSFFEYSAKHEKPNEIYNSSPSSNNHLSKNIEMECEKSDPSVISTSHSLIGSSIRRTLSVDSDGNNFKASNNQEKRLENQADKDLNKISNNLSSISIENYQKCPVCNKEANENFCRLPCNDTFHQSCLILTYKPELLKYKNLATDLKCIMCNEFISYEFLVLAAPWEPTEKNIIILQKFRKSKISCPICHSTGQSKQLNKYLKPKSKKCNCCKNSFCSFCGVKGSHFLYCSNFYSKT